MLGYLSPSCCWMMFNLKSFIYAIKSWISSQSMTIHHEYMCISDNSISMSNKIDVVVSIMFLIIQYSVKYVLMNRELSVIIVLHDIYHCLSALLTTTCSIFSLSCIALIFSINGFNFFLYIWLFISILPVSAIAPFSHPLTKSSMRTNIFHRSALTLYSTKPTSSDTTSIKLHN